MITIWLFVFVMSLYVLVKAADYFTDYAEKLGKIFKLPNFIIGVLILAVGTSLPELATSVMGVVSGDAEFLSGNVLGTVIVNILLGLSIAVLVVRKKVIFSWDIVSNDLPFFAASIFLVAISLYDGIFTFWEAILFLIGYVVYVFYAYLAQKEERKADKEKFEKQILSELKNKKPEEKVKKVKEPLFKICLYLVLSLIVVVLASKYVVDSVISIADFLGLGTSTIAATAVAIGTSLPEILVAISAARRGNFDMVIGDILGSNIFDIFVIYGVTGLFHDLSITASLYMTLIPFLIGSFFLLWLTLIDKKISKPEGVLFLLVYAFFLGKLFQIF